MNQRVKQDHSKRKDSLKKVNNWKNREIYRQISGNMGRYWEICEKYWVLWTTIGKYGQILENMGKYWEIWANIGKFVSSW